MASAISAPGGWLELGCAGAGLTPCSRESWQVLSARLAVGWNWAALGRVLLPSCARNELGCAGADFAALLCKE